MGLGMELYILFGGEGLYVSALGAGGGADGI